MTRSRTLLLEIGLYSLLFLAILSFSVSSLAVNANPEELKGQLLVANWQIDDPRFHQTAIYMMEHNAIDNVSVTLVPDDSLEITGRVDLFGEVHDFSIHWQR